MYSKEECIESIRKANEQVEDYLGANQYRELGISPSVKTLEKKFGSWSQAKEAAELESMEPGDNGKTNYVPHRFHQGYEYWEHRYEGEFTGLFVHRLLAVSEFGFEAVTREMDVHHKNEVKWDNRPENIELKDHAEHRRMHAKKEKLGTA